VQRGRPARKHDGTSATNVRGAASCANGGITVHSAQPRRRVCNGTDGNDGAKGSSGATGPRVHRPPGATGSPGAAGPAGLSVSNGNGFENDWSRSPTTASLDTAVEVDHDYHGVDDKIVSWGSATANQSIQNDFNLVRCWAHNRPTESNDFHTNGRSGRLIRRSRQ